MPELQALYEEMQDQEVNVVGIVADGMNNESALKIVHRQGVEFTNIIPDQKFTDDFVSGISVVPVTMLVNSKGEIVGNKIVGARSKGEFKKLIEQHLK
jgi:hypothetical protein